MSLLKALGAVAICLLLQAGLARLMPASCRWFDLMMVPVVWYSIRGSQRSAMLVGCVSGLAGDAWFRAGLFGLGGFNKTLLGWTLGGLGSRFDLNQPAGRFCGGAALSLAGSLLTAGFRRILDLDTAAGALWVPLVRAVLTGVAVLIAFAIVDHLTDGGTRRRVPRRA